MSMNKVTLLGHLTQDPEMKEASTGSQGCLLSLATNESWTDKSGEKKEKAEFHRVTVWGKLAEACQTHLKKGERALIEGAIHTRSWDDKNGEKKFITEITATAVHFMGNTLQAEKAAVATKTAYQANSKPVTKAPSKPQSNYQPRQNRY